jgi:signal transduction histidine kinase
MPMLLEREHQAAAPRPEPGSVGLDPGGATEPARHRVRRAHPLLVDGLLALLATGLALASLVGRVSQVRLTEDGSIRFDQADALGVALLLLGTLSLVWRRRAALLVLGVSGVAFFVYEALGYAPPLLPIAPLVALYTVAVTWTPAASARAMGIMVVGVVAAALTEHGALTDDQFLDYVIAVVAAWMLGYGLQLSRARTALAEERAAKLAGEQAARTQLAVEQEQARIARELHDIVAHHVCVIVAQASAARLVFDAGSDQTRQTLGSIESTGREALAEMRTLLGVLRPDHSGRAELSPQPRLDQLPSLVAQVERAGLPVQLTLRGQPRRLPACVEVSAYRIVQEALTNSLKHAGPARADVVVSYHRAFVGLRIRDDGWGGTADAVAGHGLIGMRQRAALLGGELVTGPASGGGFQVTAKLPVNGEPP